MIRRAWAWLTTVRPVDPALVWAECTATLDTYADSI